MDSKTLGITNRSHNVLLPPVQVTLTLTCARHSSYCFSGVPTLLLASAFSIDDFTPEIGCECSFRERTDATRGENTAGPTFLN